MPTANQMVPELQQAKKALLGKIKTTGDNPKELKFLFDTLRRVEKLQTVKDLTQSEAKVIRSNLSGILAPATAAELQSTGVDPRRASMRSRTGSSVRRAKTTAGSQNKRGSGVGPRMSGSVAQNRRRSGAAHSGRGQRTTSADVRLPAIEKESAWASKTAPPQKPLDEWAAITMFQDKSYQLEEAKKTAKKNKSKSQIKTALDQHCQLQGQQRRREAEEAVRFAEEQRRQLDEWNVAEQAKLVKRQRRAAQEKAMMDQMMQERIRAQAKEAQARMKDEQEALVRAQKEIEEKNAALLAKKLAQAERNRIIKEENQRDLVRKTAEQKRRHEHELEMTRQHQELIDRKERAREAELQAKSDKILQLMAAGSAAVQETQGKIDQDEARAARYQLQKEQELNEKASRKKRELARMRQETLDALSKQMAEQEKARARQAVELKEVAVAYKQEALRFAEEDRREKAAKRELALKNARELKKQILRQKVDPTKVGTEAPFKRQTMNSREKELNKKLLLQATALLDIA